MPINWQVFLLTIHAQAVQLPEIKEIRCDVDTVHSQVLQETLKRLERAFDGFFRRIKEGSTPGYPRYVRCSKLSDKSGERIIRSPSRFHPAVPT
ncbi:MAG: hypothetical protein AB1489_34895 [Acidobacteriota bacterium]